jgi:formylglycine-generating enzyme required for sulfatase activity
MAKNEAAVTRLKKEALSVIELSHPNIMSLYQFVSEDDSGYLIMECLDGPDLDKALADKDHFTVDEMIDVARQVGSALDYAHEVGIVHRDIKPGNLLYTKQGNKQVVKVADFGIAYQVRNSIAKLTGQDTSGGTINQINNSQPEPIEDVPEHVNAALSKALSKNPEDRFGTCTEFVECLEGRIPLTLAVGSADSPVATSDKSSVVIAIMILLCAFFGADYHYGFLGLFSESVNQSDVFLNAYGAGTSKTVSGIEFVWIPSGSFTMGSPSGEVSRGDDEGPQHKATFSKGFWMGKYEVTQSQWQSVMGSNPSKFSGSNKPVEQVSWDDCQSFLSKINSGSGSGSFSLPTEAQWEYACRAGTTTPFSYGGNITTSQVNYNGNFPYNGASKGTYREKVTAVGSFSPNRWGLYDMHGNVYEWCGDKRHDNYAGAPGDGSCWNTGTSSYRVFRGGGWISHAQLCRSASRFRGPTDLRSSYLGLRLVFSETLKKAKGTISVVTQPAGAKVKLNGFILSKEKQKNLEKEPGPHTLTVSCSGYMTQTKKIVLAAGEFKTERVVLEKSGPESGKPFKSKTGIEFVWIPSGSFTMGSPSGEVSRSDGEGPQHKETFKKGFWMGKYEVTQSQWQSVMGSNPSKFRASNNPVDSVSWEDCLTFISKLNEVVDSGKFALPTEAQWEYACRAETTTPFYLGANITTSQVNYDGNSPYNGTPKGLFRKKTTAVGSFSPNRWGLYDMHGNVYEWCGDKWHDNYAGAPGDGSCWMGTSSDRVLRGGCWRHPARSCRSASRYRFSTDIGGDAFGLRLTFSLSP